MTLSNARLYGIVDLGYVDPAKAPEMTWQMLAGGVDVVQLRAKGHSPESLIPLARQLAEMCRSSSVPFIINDHPALVPETGADGAHVGQDDITVAEARALAGPGAIIGKSTHSLEQAEQAQTEHPDYIGFGPLFATPTKPDYQPIGTNDIRKVQELLDLPIFCIGGINLENLPTLLAQGVRSAVIVSGILQATDVTAYTRQCRSALDAAAAKK